MQLSRVSARARARDYIDIIKRRSACTDITAVGTVFLLGIGYARTIYMSFEVRTAH